MTVTCTWHVTNLERDAETGHVNSVHYEVLAVDGEYNADAYGSIGLNGDLTIPFEELTEDICIDWAQNALVEKVFPTDENEDNPVSQQDRRSLLVQDIEDQLIAKIQEQKEPKTALGVPWS